MTDARIRYRIMTPADIPAGLALGRAAGWNQTEFEWNLFLQREPNGSRVAVQEDGTLLGTAATIRYENHFSWIGLVLVDPGQQRKGIGLNLMKEVLVHLKNEITVRLDATPAGREVYLKLGFVDERQMVRLQMKAGSIPLRKDTTVTRVSPGDLKDIFTWDRQVFGADRHELLESFFRQFPHYAFLMRKNNEIQGYCFGRSGDRFNHLGPIVADTTEVASDLLSSAATLASNRPLIVDVLHTDAHWMRWLTSLGFEVQRPLYRMFRGTNAFHGIPEKQFAILGPEFG